jgi:regulator of replication initiation timing
MSLEEILETIESELKHRKFRNQFLSEENEKLKAENAELKQRIAELEKYIEEKE